MPGDKTAEVQILPQAALLDPKTGEWIHFTLSEICRGALAGRADLRNCPIRVYAESAEEGEDLIAKLRENGIHFKKTGDLEPPTDVLQRNYVIVEFTYTINRTIRRCAAKYGFNFLAFHCGAEFVLGSDFDTIRRFIRFGEAPRYPLVIEEFRAILKDDSTQRRQTNGHLITLSWAATGADLMAQVSLFNYLTYSVSLARPFKGLWRPICAGLHFDVQKRKVDSLTGISVQLLP